MRLRLSIAVLALAAGACGSPSPTPTQGQVPSIQPVASKPCDNAYVPVRAGAMWTYQTTTSVQNASPQITTIQSVAADSFNEKVDNADGSTWTDTWTCTSDGLLQLQSNGGPLAAIAKGHSGIAKVTTTSNTGVTLPKSPKPGDKWGQVTEFVAEGTDVKVTVKITYASTAVGIEQVTVPAGSFNALRVDGLVNLVALFEGQQQPLIVNAKASVWLVQGIGEVKTVSSNNVESSSVDAESDLKSYSIPPQ